MRLLTQTALLSNKAIGTLKLNHLSVVLLIIHLCDDPWACRFRCVVGSVNEPDDEEPQSILSKKNCQTKTPIQFNYFA